MSTDFLESHVTLYNHNGVKWVSGDVPVDDVDIEYVTKNNYTVFNFSRHVVGPSTWSGSETEMNTPTSSPEIRLRDSTGLAGLTGTRRRVKLNIMNIPPNLDSLCMPMSENELEQVRNFLGCVAFCTSCIKLYICGTEVDRAALAKILSVKCGFDTKVSKREFTKFHAHLVERYTDDTGKTNWPNSV